MDDFVVNVRQIVQYPRKTALDPTDVVLLQESDSTGVAAGAFKSARVTDFVATALAKGGMLHLAPTGGGVAFNGATLTFQGTTFLFSAPLSVPSLRSTGDIFVAGNAVASQINVDALFNSIVENSVWSFNGRTGAVQLETNDVLRAGGAPIRDAHFGGFNTSPTAWDFRANDDQIATTAFVQMVLTQLVCSGTVITRSGPGALTTEDINTAFAAAVPPVFPTAPSPPFGDASNRIATTMFVDESIADLQEWTQQQFDILMPEGEFAPLNSPNFTGIPTGPTANAGTATGQLATCSFVQNAVTAATAGVASFNTRTGAVVLTAADVTAAGGALLASPQFTGVPQAPNAVLHNSSQQLATTAYVQGELAAVPPAAVTSFNTRTGAVVLTTADITGAGGAPLASPALSGAPTAPTAAPGDSTTHIATTAFVQAAVTGSTAGVVSFNGRTGAVSLIAADISAVGGAMVASPALTGTPTAPTATAGTNTTQLATTAFVLAAISGATAGVSSFNTRTGAVTLQAADVTGVGGALLANPAFTGVPTAPTPAQASNDTTVATTAYVRAALAAAPGGVSSWNSRTGAVTLQAADVSAAGGALIASPNFTGSPTAPTPLSTASANEIATAAWVLGRLSTLGGVSSFNGRAGVVTLTSADLTSAGGLLLAGGTMTGNLGINATGPVLTLSKAVGQGANIFGNTGPNHRWALSLGNDAPESGANVGSDLQIVRFSDAGVLLDAPIMIARPTGEVQIRGVSPGVAVAASLIGEVVDQVIHFSMAVALTDDVITALMTLTLPPGVWDVSAAAHGSFVLSVGDVVLWQASVNTAPGSFNLDARFVGYNASWITEVSGVDGRLTVNLGPVRIVVPGSAAQIWNLVVWAKTPTGTVIQGFGWIRAVRVH